MLQAITLSSTSQSGTTREVAAKVQGDGTVIGIFKRINPWERRKTNPLPIKGTLESLQNFATHNPGMFMKWVDKKCGVE
jgi:hypothetical protein